jgi:hypothetical protein
VKIKKRASVAPSFVLVYDHVTSVNWAPRMTLDVDIPQRETVICECVSKENCSVGERYILGVEICEPLLRNYAYRNRLGSGNLRAGAQNFDLMANCIIWKENLMASIYIYIYMCLILINLHWEKQR